MGSKQNNSMELEIEQIEELHRRDREASLKGDFKRLLSLFTDDAVILPPGGNRIRGTVQLKEHFLKSEAAYENITILEYNLDFEEVEILGDYAYEWGTINGASRTGEGETEHSTYHVMRILKKTAAGEWKVHRTIWNRAGSRQENRSSAGAKHAS